MISDGYALLATPDQNGRDIVEAELSTHIAAGLSRHMGRPCYIAVPVAHPQEIAQSQTQAAPQRNHNNPGYQNNQFGYEERPRLNQVDVTNQDYQQPQGQAYDLNPGQHQDEHDFRSSDP